MSVESPFTEPIDDVSGLDSTMSSAEEAWFASGRVTIQRSALTGDALR